MTMRLGATWQPTDGELDAVARTLRVPVLQSDEAEQQRTILLANAASIRQLPRRSHAPVAITIAVGIAAAAAVVVWLGLRPRADVPRVDVVALGQASFVHEQRWPSYVLRVDDGHVAIDVTTVDEAQRLIVRTADGYVETRSSQFVVGVESAGLSSVDVKRGRVDVRYQGQTIILATGQSWRATVRTADIIDAQVGERRSAAPRPAEPAATAPSTDSASRSSSSTGGVAAVEPAPQRASPTRKQTRAPVSAARAGAKPAESAPAKQPEPATGQSGLPGPSGSPTSPTSKESARAVSSTAKAGELDFRAGVAALRSGDAAAATRSFMAACSAALHDALGEDACFWVGAAANRAGQSDVARDALKQFLTQFPSSARAGEASALLGWLLYNAGELDAAEACFRQAAADRVPKVRESAERGLEAVKRKRAATR